MQGKSWAALTVTTQKHCSLHVVISKNKPLDTELPRGQGSLAQTGAVFRHQVRACSDAAAWQMASSGCSEPLFHTTSPKDSLSWLSWAFNPIYYN